MGSEMCIRDRGQQGQVQVTEVDAAQTMECAQRIQAGTQDVTADFLTKLA